MRWDYLSQTEPLPEADPEPEEPLPDADDASLDALDADDASGPYIASMRPCTSPLTMYSIYRFTICTKKAALITRAAEQTTMQIKD